jgi:2-deoxy-D-gluconate 3-dehydrogenase
MNEALIADPVRSRQILERIPAGRWGTPSDFEGAVVFLASRASDYVSGECLVVDGGWMGSEWARLCVSDHGPRCDADATP